MTGIKNMEQAAVLTLKEQVAYQQDAGAERRAERHAVRL